MNIEEMIADAQAEEAVKNSTETTTERIEKPVEQNVSINLQEYIVLKNKELDLDRLIAAIVNNVELNYDGSALDIKNSRRLVEAFRILYPEAYEDLYNSIKETEGE